MNNTTKKVWIVLAGVGLMHACAPNHDQLGGFVLGKSTDHNIAAQSIRSVDVPNSKGLAGQSGHRAVAAIDRLNSGDQPDLSDVSASGLGESADE